MPNLVGIGNSQVPTNAMLGGLAYQDSVGEITIDKIKAKILDTSNGTDIFVYDTSKDSDGGAWRKKATTQSWYNEGVSATRGARKEFPAVAVIVAERNFITIYDGDDPNLSMWMVFNTIAGGNSQGMADTPMIQIQGVDKVVHMLNGILVTGTKNEGSNYGQPVINFINEKVLRMDSQTGEGGEWIGNIAQRNEALGYRSVDHDYVIKASHVNDVAMTVLPNAPIDETTGLPIPTIAVATNSGVSVIRDDENVVDITATGYTPTDNKIDFDHLNNLLYIENAGFPQRQTIPSADVSRHTAGAGRDRVYGGTSSYIPTILGTATNIVPDFHGFVCGSTSGLTILDYDTSQSQEMVAYAAASYNTGYMVGDIKGAFLSSTDDTNLSGGNKVSNGSDWSGASSSQSSTPPTGWTGGNGATFKIETGNGAVGNYIRLYNENNGGAGPNSYMYQAITTVVGKKYKYSGTQIHRATISVYIRGGTTAGASNVFNDQFTSSSSSTPKRVFGTFTATSTTTYISLGIVSGTHNYGVGWDDIIVSETDDDRSVKNNGLHAYGTITKSAVATGAELVAYSGFNTSNYLFQPHNTDLQFGTGDYSVMLWYKGVSGSTGKREIFANLRGASSGFWLLHKEYTNKFVFDSVTDPTAYSEDVWYHVAGVRESGTAKLYVNGNLVGSASTGDNITDSSLGLYVGQSPDNNDWRTRGSLALLRISGTAPTPEQIKKIYNDEKCLYHENAKCTLHGTSDDVKALAFDDTTNVLHVGTSAGRSEFQGLNRINNTTTAVATAISVSNEFVAEQ